jgi:hypothetical protein
VLAKLEQRLSGTPLEQRSQVLDVTEACSVADFLQA